MADESAKKEEPPKEAPKTEIASDPEEDDLSDLDGQSQRPPSLTNPNTNKHSRCS